MTRKGENLVVLAEHGVRTPRGFMLGAEHYRASINGYFDELEAVLGNQDTLADFFAHLVLPEDTLEFISTEVSKITGAERFAVRSSGTVVTGGTAVDEDSMATALAGQFDSFLEVPVGAVVAAVRCCWASLFNLRSIACFGIDRGYIAASAMSVVIQEMAVAAASAVMMTVDPLGDGTAGSIDLTVGPCEALVSGVVSPDEVAFSRDTGDVLTFDIGRKERRVVYDDFASGDNARLVTNSEAVSSHPSVCHNTVRKIVDAGFRIEQIFGVPQDVELVVTVNGEIVITQARPVTALSGAVTPFNNRNYLNK